MNPAYRKILGKIHVLEEYASRLEKFIGLIEGSMKTFYEDELEKRFIWDDSDIFAPRWEETMLRQQQHDLMHLYVEYAKIETAINIIKSSIISGTSGDPRIRPVRQYDMQMRPLRTFKSTAEAARAVKGTSQGNIVAVCNLKRKHCGGYKWRYVTTGVSGDPVSWKPDRELNVMEEITLNTRIDKFNIKSKACNDKKLMEMEKALEEQRFESLSPEQRLVSRSHSLSSLHWLRKRAIDKQENCD